MKERIYQVELPDKTILTLLLTDDQMKSLVNQFKDYISKETGYTDKAIGTNTLSIDDASDDMGHSGYKTTV